MAITLYDQFGRPIKREKKPDQRMIAVAPILDGFRDYVTDGLTPERLAAIFKEADGGHVGRQAQLFEQIEEKDGHLLCERDKRKNIILDLEFEVTPASEDARDVKVAEFVTEFFRNQADWDDTVVSMQDAVGKGYTGLELVWDVSEGQAVVESFEFLEQKRFLFTDTSGVLRRYPLLLSDEFPMGEEIPPWKVLFHNYGGKSGHPSRSGIYRVAAWMILFKHYSIKDWVTFCEVYGMPLRLGKYSPGASKDDKEALYAAISSLGSDAAGIISESTKIEFVESSKGSTATDLWERLAKFCDAQNSKAILGQTLSAEVGEKGSYAASKTHDGIRLDLLKADGRAISATVRNQLIRPLVGFNFGWDTRIPGYQSKFDEDEDLNQKSEWVERITNKVAVPASWLRKEFRIPEGKKGEEMVGGPQAAAPQPMEAKLMVAADKPQVFDPSQQAIEGLADRMLDSTDLEHNESLILQAVERASSYEEAIENVLELFPELDMTGLRDMIEQGLLSAEMMGRKVAQDGH